MWIMDSGGGLQATSTTPRPSLHPHSPSTLQPLPIQHQQRKDSFAPACNGSASPSRESQRSSSSLQLPLPPQRPSSAASSTSSISLQHCQASPTNVTVPHLPPPPRPLSSPSLSTLGTAARTPSPKPRLRQADVIPARNLYRRGTSPITNSWTVRVENTTQPTTTITALEKNYNVSMENDVENPQDAVKVKFLHQQSEDEGYNGPMMKRFTSRERYLVGFCALLFVACIAFIIVAYTRDAQNRAHHHGYCLTDKCVSTAAQLMAGMDMMADPCEDFFQYACGMWNKKNVIPEDKHSYNTFEKLHDELQVTLKGLLEEPPGPHDSNATLKAKTLFRSCVNMTQITTLGDEPLKEVTSELGGWPIILSDWDNSTFSIEDVLGYIRQKYNAAILIGVWVGADDKDSSSNIVQLDQPNLGMPSREYYLNAKSESIYVKAYLNFMRGVVSLLGPPGIAVEDQLIAMLEFEKQLANVTRPQAERHDTGALYNKMTISRLQEIVPQLDWLRYLRQAISMSLTPEEEVVVFAVDYLQDMMDIVQQTDKRTVANYLIWRVVMMLAPELTENYQKVHNQYKMVLHGVKRPKIRWKKCVEFANDQMGLAVGAMFIRDNFRKQSKQTALEMIQDIREAFNNLLDENEWMDEETKAVAREKANAMNARIGYPDFITEPDQLDAKYEGLTFEEDYYFSNILAIRGFEALKTMSKLGKPVERDEWEQEPAVVNAFYNPNSNDIVFPAGILQPLFYSEHFPKSLNYGGIGVVIGHEITHGFDDKGRQYDMNGNLKQWWDNQTIQAFQERAQCIIDQYSGFKLEQTGLYIDGKNTQGENIADNGGLKQAYRAYRKWIEKHGEETPLPGINLNHDQLFFLNYAQIWCGKTRDEEALHGIRTSVHSPGPIRVLGPLSNSEDFARSYSCPLGSRMNPVHKCSVW